MKIYIKYIFLIVVSVMLTTISSCSSRRMNKTIIEETSADKKNIDLKVDSSFTNTTNISSVNTNLIDKYKLHNDLLIEYTPTFDINGNLIPFHYTKEENGNKTNVSITGNAKVVSNSTQEKEQSYTKETTNYQSQIDALVKRNIILVSEINKIKNTKTKEVEVKPDYFKYIIWIGIGLFFLSAVIIAVIIYFRVTIGKYKKLLNTVIDNGT